MEKKELTKPSSSSLSSIAMDYAVTVRNSSSQDVQLQCYCTWTACQPSDVKIQQDYLPSCDVCNHIKITNNNNNNNTLK